MKRHTCLRFQLPSEHAIVFVSSHKLSVSGPTDAPTDAADVSDDASDESEDEFSIPIPVVPTTAPEDILEQQRVEADAVWSAWMALAINWDEYAVGADLKTMATGRKKVAYDVWKLYKSIDVLVWFRDVGQKTYPSIAVLARAYLAKPMSNAYQERFFSTAGNVLAKNRLFMDADRAEKLQMLKHNAEKVPLLKQESRTLSTE